MNIERDVASHYATNGLLARIERALQALGVDPEQAKPEDLKPVDEFHIGGVAATKALLDQVDLKPGMHLLDIGSGIGGTPRFIAGTYGCEVTGVDLTPEFVEAATALSEMVGMGDQVRFQVGSALDLPVDTAHFDAASLLHVGMNISDKAGLMAEAARALKPGAVFAVYDVMKTGDAPIIFPVPWSSQPETSFLASLEDYVAAAERAGFTVIAHRARRDFALEFFAKMRAKLEADGPPTLGLHLVMGETAGLKVKNMVENISTGRIAPTELILRRAS